MAAADKKFSNVANVPSQFAKICRWDALQRDDLNVQHKQGTTSNVENEPQKEHVDTDEKMPKNESVS